MGNCVVCNIVILGKGKYFCSRKCQRNRQKIKTAFVENICITCGNKFLHMRNRKRGFCSNKCSSKWRVKNYDPPRYWFGKKFSEKHRNNLSLSHTGIKYHLSPEVISKKIDIALSNTINGQYGYGKVGFREDLNTFFRSKLEANLARLLNLCNIGWVYESKECRFFLGNFGTLILDFYLPEYDMYIEGKGYLNPISRDKLSQFTIAYPSLHVKIFDNEAQHILQKKYSKSIPNWEY